MQSTFFKKILNEVKTRGKKVIVVAAAEDVEVLEAIKDAVNLGFVSPILIGNKNKIYEIANKIKLDVKNTEINDVDDVSESCLLAAKLVKEGTADIIMKGIVSSDIFLKAILNKDIGLVNNRLLSHIAIFESPYYHKPFIVTDVAININPDLLHKKQIIENAVAVSRRLGILKPKVAVLAATEKVIPEIEATVHASLLSEMNKKNEITNCIVDGPLAMDNIVSYEAAKHKGIISEVAGDADIILAPDLNTGNAIFKTLNFMGGAACGAIVTGADVPVVLTSRADNEKNKLNSIVLALYLCN